MEFLHERQGVRSQYDSAERMPAEVWAVYIHLTRKAAEEEAKETPPQVLDAERRMFEELRRRSFGDA